MQDILQTRQWYNNIYFLAIYLEQFWIYNFIKVTVDLCVLWKMIKNVNIQENMAMMSLSETSKSHSIIL